MRFLGNKEKKKLIELLPKGYIFLKKDEIKEEDNILYKNSEKYLICEVDNNDKKEIKYLPHLKSIPKDKYKSVYVDRGAIPFIIKGADLMRPGIVKIEDEIKKEEIVMIKDEEHNKLLALGFSLFNSNDMKNQEKGKSVQIYHYFNDDKY